MATINHIFKNGTKTQNINGYVIRDKAIIDVIRRMEEERWAKAEEKEQESQS